jgi:hypothetical protein
VPRQHTEIQVPSFVKAILYVSQFTELEHREKCSLVVWPKHPFPTLKCPPKQLLGFILAVWHSNVQFRETMSSQKHLNVIKSRTVSIFLRFCCNRSSASSTRPWS